PHFCHCQNQVKIVRRVLHQLKNALNVHGVTTVSSDRSALSAAYVAPRAAPRVTSVDVVRGAVMVLMALDHVRDYVTNQRFRPEDLRRSTEAMFAKRCDTPFVR